VVNGLIFGAKYAAFVVFAFAMLGVPCWLAAVEHYVAAGVTFFLMLSIMAAWMYVATGGE